MFFLKTSNINISFSKNTLIKKFYTIIKFLSTIKQVSIINLKQSIIVALDIDSKIFVVYMAIWEQKDIFVYLKK